MYQATARYKQNIPRYKKVETNDVPGRPGTKNKCDQAGPWYKLKIMYHGPARPGPVQTNKK
jgi:hypothetical protein